MKINNHTKLSIVVIVVAALLRQLMTRQPQIVGVSFGFVPGYIHGGQGDSKYGICIYEKDDKLIERPFDVDYIGRPWYVQAFHVLLHLLGLLLLAFIVFRSVAHLRRLQAGVKPLYLRARK